MRRTPHEIAEEIAQWISGDAHARAAIRRRIADAIEAERHATIDLIRRRRGGAVMSTTRVGDDPSAAPLDTAALDKIEMELRARAEGWAATVEGPRPDPTSLLEWRAADAIRRLRASVSRLIDQHAALLVRERT